ncbi:16S rRNA m(7)G-527 methyltransferase [Nocardioides terrae]|uniref:Ribosomal RNA small subunit methyltransferase G n=1 Tax=Nocardioides terrae TaxID=574651 RepID=A0A1I1N893_9ACTN|nr:16S rRNA (guanine(527)-N(7))-methyltransferase RsmG [Nocardioides terrae]SFC90993.1 16S rRNA m(7)G-527 methyltransferase [Nocardioides terrae]
MSDLPEPGAATSAPPVPDVARSVFPPDRLPLAETYAAWLADGGVVRGLIGPREVPRLWDRHILNCAVLASALPKTGSVADIGSGAGLPGLVVAIARPALRVTLVEPLLRRTSFLNEVVEDLGLTNVEVVRGRADVLHGVRTFDAVTSRAVAPLGRLLEWSMPLVAPTGVLVAMKGSSVSEEIEDARLVLRRFGCAEPEVSQLGDGLLESTTVCLRVAWADPAKVSWPPARRPGGSSKKKRGQRDRRREA